MGNLSVDGTNVPISLVSNAEKKVENKTEKNVVVDVPVGKPTNNTSQTTQQINGREVNSNKNSFMKEYILGKASTENVEIPNGLNIEISSPSEFSKEYKDLLRYVRTEIYGARVNDMFKLLSEDANTVDEKVAKMKISDADKAKIKQLKHLYDQYYTIEASYNGKQYNLLNLTDKDKAELKNISPSFEEFVDKNQADLKKQVNKFTKGEVEAVELSSAAQTSKDFVPTLLKILAVTTGYGVFKNVYDDHKNKQNHKAFMNEVRATSREKIGFVNPFSDISDKMKANKNWKSKLLALTGVAFFTLAGSADDISGCIKDYKQDKDNFGVGKALPLAILSAVGGVASSFLIGSTMDKIGDINRAKTVKKKEFMNTLSNGEKERANRLLKRLKPSKLAQLKGLGKMAGLGMLIASCSSGSSWVSMAGTRHFLSQNGDDLVEKNIIDKKDNTFKNTSDNMMEYEAYKGKWRGIAVGPTSDPVVGATFATTGLLFNANPFISSCAFGLQGCSETLTACGYQLLGDDMREGTLEKQKKELVDSTKTNV